MRFSLLKSAHGTRAVKTFTAEGVQSFPLIKMFDSADFTLENTLDGLKEKTLLCKKAAIEGACMLKGYVTEPLCNQSRAGMVNKDAPTDSLILDIDGVLLDGTTITTPIDKPQVKDLAEKVVMQLPQAFHGASYIVHASSSMGMKGDKVCLHLEFLLQELVYPQALKEYVVYLNHHIQLFERNLSLSASGTALRYPLDRTVIDNSHIIYLGHPGFKDGIGDPIPNPEDRIFLVEKHGVTVNLAPEIKEHADAAKNRRYTDKKINDLRALEGLPKRNEKTTRITIDGQSTHVVTNPEFCQMTFARDNGDWVAYNVNGGDSAGYYVSKLNPTVVRNFKGEPNFLFQAADPETYLLHLDTFIGAAHASEQEASATPPMPLIFRDEASNAYYNALLNPATGSIDRIAKASREGLPDWMAQYEGVMPKNVPIWRYEFNPHREEIVSFRERFINKYIPSHLMTQEAPENFVPLAYDTGHKLQGDCPRIFELLLHVVGGDIAVYKHFLNWLATAFQLKDKLGTAWILQGTQGTGKGVFYEKVLSPLVGTGVNQEQPYVTKIRLENIEEQYNQWQECSLFTFLDEFRLSDSQKSQKLFNKIKSMITEVHEPIRGMRENMRTVRTYTNFVFLSNDQDAMYLPEDDRRFNIGDRQETPLKELWSDEAKIIEHALPQELQLFAVHMMEYQIDHRKARTVIENEAKQQMRETSQNTIEEFVVAFKQGDLSYFLMVFDGAKATSDFAAKETLCLVLKRLLESSRPRISVNELRLLFCSLVQHSDNANKFGSLMRKNRLPSRKMRIDGRSIRGYDIEWDFCTDEVVEILRQYQEENIVAFPKAC